MNLFYREFGQGSPIIVLHGLYGSSDNWVSIAKQLEAHYRIILVDQRNHGNSPHCKTHSYGDLANDLYELVRLLNVEEFHLMGHSMGGRVAMLFQTLYPNYVKSLIVVDVAPWSYSGVDAWFLQSYNEHRSIIRGMRSLDIANVRSRIDADNQLAIAIPSMKLRQFLFKNLRRDSKGAFYWAINLPVLESSLEDMILGVDIDRRYTQKLKVLFIKGADSEYISENRIQEILEVYPMAEIVNIKHAGHWVHAEQPVIFVNEIRRFLAT
ncbi:MAG: alpha/beta fold hydrolase [Bacteroidales bacterium]